MMRELCVALVILVSCSHPPKPPMSSNDCTDAIAGLASADPARMRPLPATCTVDDVTKTLHSLDTRSFGTLAQRKDRVAIHWFSSERLPKIHAWVDEAGHVLLLDAEWPPAPIEDYVKVLGPHEHTLDYQWRGDPLKDAERVWLGRGVVVVSSPAVKGVLRVGVFAPTTLEDYKANLQFIDREDIDEG